MHTRWLWAGLFWFQDRWKTYVSTSHTLHAWLGATSPATAKRHRALLWLTTAAPGQALPAWLPATTRIHLAAPDADRDALRKILAEIDADAVLPVDFIVAPAARKALAKATRRQGVPLVALD